MVIAAAIHALLALVEREPIAYFLPALSAVDEVTTGALFTLSETAPVAQAELSAALLTFAISPV